MAGCASSDKFILLVPNRPGDTEPLSQWYHSGTFKTAADCNSLVAWMMSDEYAKHARGTPAQIQEFQSTLKDAKCVPTDDPRLKE
jgi:hypothetical protein